MRAIDGMSIACTDCVKKAVAVTRDLTDPAIDRATFAFLFRFVVLQDGDVVSFSESKLFLPVPGDSSVLFHKEPLVVDRRRWNPGRISIFGGGNVGRTSVTARNFS